MNNLKVVYISSTYLKFDNGVKLYSDHDTEYYEKHYLDFEHLDLEDFKNLEFDLTTDNFFRRIDGYGIELIPIKGGSVKIPGYASNNGYYSDKLTLIISDGKSFNKEFDITECQCHTKDDY